MSEAFATRGWQRIQRLAAVEDPAEGNLRYKFYVTEVDAADPAFPYAFCVGLTGTSAERRLEQHQSGGDRAARMFRSGRARAMRLRYDLMAGLPTFRTLEVAEAAEGTLARVISANVGRAHSDRARNRRRTSA